MPEVVPAILVKTEEEFTKRIGLVAPYVRRVQWDIMDGKFVDNTTFSDPSVLERLEKYPSLAGLEIEADLMVVDPLIWIDRLDHPGVNRLIFHVTPKTTADELEELFSTAKIGNMVSIGWALEPETPIEQIAGYETVASVIQVMGVKSGFGGQEFIPSALDKIRELRQKFPNMLISVDGGVNEKTVPEIVSAGATTLCVGSYIFNSGDPQKAIQNLREVSGNS